MKHGIIDFKWKMYVKQQNDAIVPTSPDGSAFQSKLNPCDNLVIKMFLCRKFKAIHL